jgi:hypothetical protein
LISHVFIQIILAYLMTICFSPGTSDLLAFLCHSFPRDGQLTKVSVCVYECVCVCVCVCARTHARVHVRACVTSAVEINHKHHGHC